MTRELAEILVTEHGCEETQMCDYEEVKNVLRRIFDQHEAEKAQLHELLSTANKKWYACKERNKTKVLRLEAEKKELQDRVKELEEGIDELEKDEAFFNLHKDGFLRYVRNIEKQLDVILKQLNGEVVARFKTSTFCHAPMNGITTEVTAYEVYDLKVIDELNWNHDNGGVFEFLIIKQVENNG